MLFFGASWWLCAVLIFSSSSIWCFPNVLCFNEANKLSNGGSSVFRKENMFISTRTDRSALSPKVMDIIPHLCHLPSTRPSRVILKIILALMYHDFWTAFHVHIHCSALIKGAANLGICTIKLKETYSLVSINRNMMTSLADLLGSKPCLLSIWVSLQPRLWALLTTMCTQYLKSYELHWQNTKFSNGRYYIIF